MGFFSRRKSEDLPEAPSLKKAAEGAKKDALSRLRTASIRSAVTDNINQKQFSGYALAKATGKPMPDAIQERFNRARKASDLANTYALMSGASRVEQHDVTTKAVNDVYKKVTSREDKRRMKLMDKMMGTSAKKINKEQRKQLKAYDKKYPNSVEKWMD